ncbi:pectinesterase family protein [Galbibacter sp.]|uniref:pectinesterase family protein n=1 Tax=Galbibacter sp. TaxID=2918471 RepID=UPI002CF933E5|nr:pectinesterase family protein [Galbibacter sp.]HLV63803.1 pectinesterase family protein [Galbibacter sp.]
MLKKSLALGYLLLLCCFSLSAQQLAFPGAEGFGRYTTGGRGGKVYVVTNLNDDGEGSLRKGIVKDGPRIIVFAVSGTIDLKSPLDINKPNLTILGQTAPPKGITLKGYPLNVKADNVIIRYIRCRMGDINAIESDALGGRDLNGVIIDHCSVSWAVDENVSFYRNENFTLQWCIISEALNNSVHSKGAHGYGGIWGGVNASFHHNLIANNNSRNPRFSGSKSTKNNKNEFVDFRNNVIYNWGFNSVYGGENGTYSMVNNYFKPGPATTKPDRIVNPSKPYGKFYVTGNFIEGSQRISQDNWDGGVQCDQPELTKLTLAPNIDNVKTHQPKQAYRLVIREAGHSLYRDAVDLRIIQGVKTTTATYKKGIIDSQEQVGGWPKIPENSIEKDTDLDGIPDFWEDQHGLDKTKNDAGLHTLDEHYVNIEVYANSLVPSVYDFTVAPDGSGDFLKIQQAIDAVPDFRRNRTYIYIKNGVYKEKLVLPSSKTNVSLIGQDVEKTIITNDDFAAKVNDFGEEMGTTGSSTFFVFGDGFKAENLSFENSAGNVGQAVAVRVSADRVVFYKCKFIGNQDTLYLQGANSRQYYKECYIEGTVDFIFGASTALFENCTIKSKSKGYITAASTPKVASYGMVFKNCKLISEAQKNSVYLGRPWRNYAQTVWIDCYMGDHIKPLGWHNWNKPEAERTVFYAEYNSSGPGATSNRVAWAKKLTKNKMLEYRKENIFKGNDNWNPTINN